MIMKNFLEVLLAVSSKDLVNYRIKFFDFIEFILYMSNHNKIGKIGFNTINRKTFDKRSKLYYKKIY